MCKAKILFGVVVGLCVALQARAALEEPKEADRAGFEPPKMLKFADFTRTFHKQYASLLEEATRRTLYLGRVFLSFMSSISYKHRKASSYLAVNEMSDWTEKEYESILIKVDEANKPALEIPETEEANIIEGFYVDAEGELKSVKMEVAGDGKNKTNTRTKRDVLGGLLSGNSQPNDKSNELFRDHRVARCLQPVKSQGHCGSCYIFATMALYEWMYCMDSGQRRAFSEQFVLDCGKPVGVSGCGGGLVTEVSDFVALLGVEWSENYPYVARTRTCPVKLDIPKPTQQVEEKADASAVATQNEEVLGSHELGVGRFTEPTIVMVKPTHLESLLDQGPVVVGLFVPYLFMMYGGGVDRGRHCFKKGSVFAHTMLLIGDGREDGQDYWLFRNSHSNKWGEAGHYRIAKDSKCFFDYVQVPMDYFSWARFSSFVENPTYSPRLVENLRARNDGGGLLSRIFG